MKSMTTAKDITILRGRAPYGARGLKLTLTERMSRQEMSRPVWGAWIEIPPAYLVIDGLPGGRAPYGARGLKSGRAFAETATYRRAPYGARGLK